MKPTLFLSVPLAIVFVGLAGCSARDNTTGHGAQKTQEKALPTLAERKYAQRMSAFLDYCEQTGNLLQGGDWKVLDEARKTQIRELHAAIPTAIPHEEWAVAAAAECLNLYILIDTAGRDAAIARGKIGTGQRLLAEPSLIGNDGISKVSDKIEALENQAVKDARKTAEEIGSLVPKVRAKIPDSVLKGS